MPVCPELGCLRTKDFEADKLELLVILPGHSRTLLLLLFYLCDPRMHLVGLVTWYWKLGLIVSWATAQPIGGCHWTRHQS